MRKTLIVTLLSSLLTLPAHADENLFGYIKGAEVLPDGALEFYQVVTQRSDKGVGKYTAYNTETELEYGVSDRFTIKGELKGQAIDTSGLLIDAYMPGDEKYGLKFQGVEIAGKYNFLSPALDDFGLSVTTGLDYLVLDPHSGRDKDTVSIDLELELQKYFMEGQLIWAANFGTEATRAKRKPIDNLPEDFEWPTGMEVEIEFWAGTGLSYRFVPNWFIGVETLYETEYETEVAMERQSLFAGPSLHYGGADYWFTLTYFDQISGGGEGFDGQPDGLHLIEKTEQEIRFKLGLNF
ncbi:DUF6662 family protein [Cellvibrio sp. OA-2007]|uniref:DUF6662 family protein n=1 Tax=Cellvibrio sp. OA-2007 TaxID=529823 RepID=UPI000782BD82|nr:DUF6662 family protein [Cellvibrio sp. OA-2007]